jgi:thiol-disulfide isomerase/thioredoxin
MSKPWWMLLVLGINAFPLHAQQSGLGERKTAASQLKSIGQLQVQTLDGKSWEAKKLRGKFVIVNFWATWCKPCVKEMPDFQALSQRTDVAILGLAYEEADDKDLLSFLKKVKVTYPVAKMDVYAPLPAPLEVPRGLPTTLVFDRNGDLLKKFLGPVTKADLEQTISAAGKK